MTQLIPVITVDGPSGSGKGTLARQLAMKLGWHLLDSGALYRLLALKWFKENNQAEPDLPTDNKRLAELASCLDIRFEINEQGGERILLDGQDVTEQVRAEATGEKASIVAAIPAVRQALLERQRDFLQPPGLVADGRDMGTVVFSDADAKFFLTASAEVRAERRYKQLKELGISASLPRLVQDIASRDERDSCREVSPLIPAQDAVQLDSTKLSIDQVIESALRTCQNKGLIAE